MSASRFTIVILIVTGFGVLHLTTLHNSGRVCECNCNTAPENGHPVVSQDELEILNNSQIAMDDPRLIQLIRTKFIQTPSNLPYNFSNPELAQNDDNPSKGAVQTVAKILEQMVDDPFYLECGANDGEWGSNSIWLERTLGWQGLLVEADALTFRKLEWKHRKAFSGKFCLAITDHPSIVNFYVDERGEGSARLGSSLRKSQQHHALKPEPVQCFPLHSVLLAMNRTTVDFFSLDVESNELDVLMTVPFDKVIFKVITIEKILVRQGQAALKQFMVDKGYRHLKDVNQDTIFLHPSVQI